MKPIAPESGPAYLFCPASRPDRYQKALDAADFAIFDLEDAVAPADKAAARQALIDNPVDPDAVIVRVNAIGTPDHALDLEALERPRTAGSWCRRRRIPRRSRSWIGSRSSRSARRRVACCGHRRSRRCRAWWR